ncbi:MAG: acetyl-CoA acetyltransferase, partial [Arthrobacter sp.]|nr:acetyl-CoA acetyltransferase [Arthrobacter sp.]
MSLREQFGKDVLLTGWGHSRFGKLTDETLESLIVQVATEAIGNAGIEPGQLDEIYLGQFNSGMMPLAFPSSLALQVSEQLANVPATRVENACASGSAAFQQGTKSLLAGTAKTVLVIGAEKMTHAGADVVGAALLGADYDMAGKASTTGFTGLFADVAKHYEKRYGAAIGNLGDVLGTIAAKNHRNGVDNPYAQLRKDLGEEFCRTVS